MASNWKKGRGKLGFMQPLLGKWVAQSESPMGPMRCTRVFEPILGGAFIQLSAHWEFMSAAAKKSMKKKSSSASNDSAESGGGGYREIALIGAGSDGKVSFWSFTSDGKRSEGTVADVSDLHASAIGFEAQMPAGFARMAYWPADDGGFKWVVESRNAKGWRRFVEHHYRPS